MILKLHSETPYVRGYNRGCIYDLPRGKYDFVPNIFFSKIKSLINVEQSVIYETLTTEEKLWLDFLLDNEYCFFISKEFIDNFPDIKFKWKSPSVLTNAIIDISNLRSELNTKTIEELNCKHLLIRFFNGDFSKDGF